MSIYEIIVNEQTRKVVHVEAENEDDAQQNLTAGNVITNTTVNYHVEKPRRISW